MAGGVIEYKSIPGASTINLSFWLSWSFDTFFNIYVKSEIFGEFSEEQKQKKEVGNRRPLQEIGNMVNFNNVPIIK